MTIDPITLQVMIGGLRAACDEMGATLIRSAYSANIKERHDCSTALFDSRGELVMQAEHIPVHLGSMPDAVAAVLGEEQRPGSAWILNDPYRGGTHLPDITLISPVFADGELLKSYVINLGPAPEGQKAWQGDGKTPEGDLFICSVNRQSQFTRFLALAYPTPADAARGVAASKLKPADADAVRAAWKVKTHCPPQQTALGGMVGIHGKGGWEHRDGHYEVVDWTLGCVGLRDADILELFTGYAEVGIPVHID